MSKVDTKKMTMHWCVANVWCIFGVLCALLTASCGSTSSASPAPFRTPPPEATMITTPITSTGCGKPAPTPPGSSVNETILSGGLTRTYLLHVPSGYQAHSSEALVLNFHGHGSQAMQQEHRSGMSLLADQQDFIVVYPQGVVGPDGRTGWGTGARGRPQVNDVLFVSDLLTHLQSVLCIDPLRIYATGFSNGGGMTNVLACTLAGRLAAFAPVSGSYPPYPGSCHPVRPVPLLEFHGTADRVVPYNGSERHQYPSILAWLQGWATRDGCTMGPTIFYTQGNVSGLEWKDCRASATVVHFRLQGEGHVWPSVRFNIRFNMSGGPPGTTVQALSASALIWSFFQQHPLASQVKETEQYVRGKQSNKQSK
ncbi:MAG: alpha/beta hydrolase family esterase [Ktedonobacteraceae bacterium]